jgi:hypothetical protein
MCHTGAVLLGREDENGGILMGGLKKTSIRMDGETHERALRRIDLNKKNMRGPVSLGRMIEVALEGYLDGEDEYDKYQAETKSSGWQAPGI